MKQGWSWPAFLFVFIWAMARNMWWIGIATLLGLVGLIVASVSMLFMRLAILGTDIEAELGIDDIVAPGVGTRSLVNLAIIGVNVLFGVFGNSWRESKLIKQGYELRTTVSAANPAGAIVLADQG